MRVLSVLLISAFVVSACEHVEVADRRATKDEPPLSLPQEGGKNTELAAAIQRCGPTITVQRPDSVGDSMHDYRCRRDEDNGKQGSADPWGLLYPQFPLDGVVEPTRTRNVNEDDVGLPFGEPPE